MLKHGILGLLSYKDMTGYEVMEIFRDSLNFFWTAQTSQIYRELQTLEKNGWAHSMTVAQSGKPDKKVFHITESGREELQNWVSDGKFRTENNSLLLKVFFLGEVDKQVAISLFENYREACINSTKVLSGVPDIIDSYKGIITDESKALYWKMTAEYGRIIAKASKEWSEYCLKLLEEN